MLSSRCLAARAIVRAAPGHHGALDRGATDGARRPRLAEDAELVLVAARPPPCGAVIAERGAALPEGLREHRHDGLVQGPDLGAAQRRERAPRMNARPKQRLVGVNV